MQRSAINEVPEANPFGTPLDPTSVYTLAANFIVSCPASNAPLPFVPFPALTVDASVCTCEEPTCDVELAKRDGWSGSGSPCKPGNGGGNSRDCSPAKAGAPVKLTAASKIPAGSFVTFVSGLSVVSVPGTIDADGVDITAVIPSIAQGQTYVFITSSDVEGTFSDSAVLFGPAVLEGKLFPLRLLSTEIVLILIPPSLPTPTIDRLHHLVDHGQEHYGSSKPQPAFVQTFHIMVRGVVHSTFLALVVFVVERCW